MKSAGGNEKNTGQFPPGRAPTEDLVSFREVDVRKAIRSVAVAKTPGPETVPPEAD